jgi:hypothetical protein
VSATPEPNDLFTPANNHGTTAGWTDHMRERSEPCPPCRLAHNLNMQQHRARARAWRNAARKLAERHSDEFLELLEREQRRHGDDRRD